MPFRFNCRDDIARLLNQLNKMAGNFLECVLLSRTHMKHRYKAFISLSLVMVCFLPAVAQQPKESEIRKLLTKSRSQDRSISEPAKESLSKLDKSSLPTLVSILKKASNPCDQITAAGYIVDLDPKNPEIVPAMTEVTRGGSLRTLFHLQEEMICRRGAAFMLASSTEGIAVLKQLLTEGDTWEKQSAIFALDDLTESSNYPEGSIPAMKEVIPEIAKATKAKDDVLSEMAGEVLAQIARGPNTELSELAKKHMTTGR